MEPDLQQQQQQQHSLFPMEPDFFKEKNMESALALQIQVLEQIKMLK